MTVLRLALLISVVAFTTVGQQNPEQLPVAPASCPVTLAPAVPFTPPGCPELDENDNTFWFGTGKLWTRLRRPGNVWGWGPHAPGHEHEVQPLTAKIFWFSLDYDRHREGNADLK